jgi:hypothetical protein
MAGSIAELNPPERRFPLPAEKGHKGMGWYNAGNPQPQAFESKCKQQTAMKSRTVERGFD